MNTKHFLDALPKSERDWLEDAIIDWWSKNDPFPGDIYHFVDNERLARMDDAVSLNAFDLAEKNGCCGSVSVKFGRSPTGVVYMYGFNHGH